METEKCIFNNDPLYMKNLVGKEITINTIENKMYKGIVYVIDPETKTVVLATKVGSKTNLDFILYNSIKSLEVVSSTVVNQEFLFEEGTLKLSEHPEELISKKAKLKEWLKMNHIDIKEEGNLLMLNDQCTIEPPYGTEQCLCNNTIVLDSIRALIKKMPS